MYDDRVIFSERYTGRERAAPPAVRMSAIAAIAGFVVAIAIGTALLSVPLATADGKPASVSTALFTAVSAVCVTGLVVVDTGSFWSPFGQWVIMLLVEIGGLGFGAYATFLFLLVGRNISLSDRLNLQAMLPGSTLNTIWRTAGYILGATLVTQAVGAIVLYIHWSGKLAPDTAAFFAAFHAVAAFCNAGFDLFGSLGAPGSSLAPERHSFALIGTASLLAIIGGLGFPVLSEIASWRPRRFRRWRAEQRMEPVLPRPPLSLNARLVLVSHLGLFLASIPVIWLIEWDNVKTMAGESLGLQFTDAMGAAAFPRSAGFTSIPLLNFSQTSLFFMLVLMFIGSASAGTGGGVKVNTVATLFASVGATMLGRPRPQIFKRSLPQESINKALAVVVVSAVMLSLGSLALSITDPQIPVENLVFEAVSAFSTVGLSLDVTAHLSEPGRAITEVMMFVGRLGPLTMVALLSSRERPQPYNYVEEPVLIA
jgi:trk system potassium uptake protein TrkH